MAGRRGSGVGRMSLCFRAKGLQTSYAGRSQAAFRDGAFRLKLALTIKQSDPELGNPSALYDSIG